MRKIGVILSMFISLNLSAQNNTTVSEYLKKIDYYYKSLNVKYVFLTLMEADSIYPQNKEIKYSYAKHLYYLKFYKEALPYFYEAKNLGKNDGEFNFYFGISFLFNNKYIGAIHSFNEAKKDSTWNDEDFNLIYNWALNGKEVSKNYDTTIIIKNLGAPINTELCEERILFYENEILFNRYNLKTMNDFERDIFRSINNVVEKYFNKELNNEYKNRIVQSIFKDGSLVFFKSKLYETYGDIIIKNPDQRYLYQYQINKEILNKKASNLIDGNIQNIQEINDSLLLFEVVYEHLTTKNTSIEDKHDGFIVKTTYLSNNVYNLFVFNKNSKGVKKLDISSEINFSAWANYGNNEIFVSMINEDSYGYSDIYKLNITNLDSLTIEHLPYPINSGAHDLDYIEHDGKAYFSSNRPGGFGSYDIWYYDLPKE